MITGDADLFPLDKRFHVLPKFMKGAYSDFDIVMSNTIAGGGTLPKTVDKTGVKYGYMKRSKRHAEWIQEMMTDHSPARPNRDEYRMF